MLKSCCPLFKKKDATWLDTSQNLPDRARNVGSHEEVMARICNPVDESSCCCPPSISRVTLRGKRSFVIAFKLESFHIVLLLDSCKMEMLCVYKMTLLKRCEREKTDMLSTCKSR